jgi:selenocysteine-specific elongation factor
VSRDPAEAQASPRAHLVLGTAGHIDHGKTSLIRALTGVDTDRLPEEKARGITIELGFAALDLDDETRLSVVDVPGHEGLVRTMVSGATGIDLMLLVVAADEGVMPQTREHVAICDLLGIERGVVAITKVDIADEELVELVQEEVGELLEATGLCSAEVVPVSSETGEGIEALRSALLGLAAKARPHTTRRGPPRLGVDRVFAMRGFGTVVTGTLLGAPLSTGEAVELLPSGKRSKVRGLQSHGEESKTAVPGTRCAVNLQNLEISELSRGDVLTRVDGLHPTSTMDVSLWWLESAPDTEGTTAVELLVGTAERRARLAPIGTNGFTPGGRSFARLHVDGDPVALLPGDRFIVRGFARNETWGATVGGGTILDVAPPHRRRSDPALLRELETLAGGGTKQGVRERVRRAGYQGVDARALEREVGVERRELSGLLEELAVEGEILSVGAHLWLERSLVERMEESLASVLERFHADEPMRPGMPRASLRGQLPQNVPSEASELVLSRLEAAKRIVSAGDLVRASAHRTTLDAGAKAAVAQILSEAKQSGLEPPSPREWSERLGVSLDRFRDLVAHLEREGELVRAPGDLWFSREAVDALREKVRSHLEAHGELDTQTYKGLIGTSRRTAMPLMELLDELHVTRRHGEVRVLRGRS